MLTNVLNVYEDGNKFTVNQKQLKFKIRFLTNNTVHNTVIIRAFGVYIIVVFKNGIIYN